MLGRQGKCKQTHVFSSLKLIDSFNIKLQSLIKYITSRSPGSKSIEFYMYPSSEKWLSELDVDQILWKIPIHSSTKKNTKLGNSGKHLVHDASNRSYSWR